MRVLPLPLFAVVLASCSSGNVTTNVEPEQMLLPVGFSVPDGQLLVVNDPEVHFHFLIKGEHFKSVPAQETPIAMIVDSIFVQVTTQAISEFYDGDPSELSHEALLARHQNYEVEYLGSQVNGQYRIYQEPLTLENGRKCLLWTIDAPGIPTQALISTVVGPRVLLIGSAFNRQDSRQVETVVDMLISAVKSVTTSETPIGMTQVHELVSEQTSGDE